MAAAEAMVGSSPGAGSSVMASTALSLRLCAVAGMAAAAATAATVKAAIQVIREEGRVIVVSCEGRG